MSKKQNVFNGRKNKRDQEVTVRPSNGKTPDRLWDDLNTVYLECCAVSTTPATTLPLIKDVELVEKVENKQELIESAGMLSRDAKEYAERLEAIHSKHKEFSGKTNSPEEMMFAMQLGEEYQNWLESYQTVVLPTTNKILAMFEYAKSGHDEDVSE
jgi:hypothetical protein